MATEALTPVATPTNLIRWLQHLGRRRVIQLAVGGVVAAVAFVFAFSAVFGSHGDEIIDLASEPNLTVEHDGALFVQGGIGAGTGNFDPFSTANPGGSTSPEEAINVCTNGGPGPSLTGCPSEYFDTHTGGDRSHEIKLSAIPEITIDGNVYREFSLDANDQGSDDYMSIDEIHILLDEQVDLAGYNPGTKQFDASDTGEAALKVYELDMPILMRSQTFTPGSGVSDITVLVPTEVFDAALHPGEDCSYGSVNCDQWLYFYFKAGDFVESDITGDLPAAIQGQDWDVTSGFEEWRTRLLPVVNVSKDATASVDERHDWDVAKSVDPLSQGAFAGDPVDWTWTIDITETITTDNVQMGGTISVFNPTGGNGPINRSITATVLNVTDVLDQGGVSTDLSTTVDCGVGFPYDLAAGETLVCTYGDNTVDPIDGVNTATAEIEFLEGQTMTHSGSADVVFQTNVVNDDATWDDEYLDLFDQVAVAGSYDFTEDDVCSTVQADYGADGKYTVSLDNTVILTDEEGTAYQGDASTSYTCYAPVLEKDATGSYDERHTWDIEKSVTPTTQNAFAGDPVGWTWTVTLSESSVDENFAVTGSIDVTNPLGSPGDMTVVVGDQLDDGTIGVVTCPGGGSSVTVSPGTTETCTYVASPEDAGATLNTAYGSFNGGVYSDSADVTFTANVINGTATVDDDQEPDFPLVLSVGDGPWEWTETQGDTCSTDAADYVVGGKYSDTRFNTATVTASDGQSDSASADTTYNCYLWDVAKTADGTYNDRYRWEIDKTVDPPEQWGLPGETLSWDWTVSWESFLVGEENHAVTGVITVTNPAPLELTVDVADELTGPFPATVTCNDADGGTDLTIDALGSGTCSYTAAPGSQLAQNTATATRNSVSVSNTVDVIWEQLADQGLDASISDTQFGPIPVDGANPFTYTQEEVCSTDEADYVVDDSYAGFAINEATVTWDQGSDSDDARTDYTCYMPTVDKTVDTSSYELRRIWTLTKTVDPASPPVPAQTGDPGDALDWTWTVTWSPEDVETPNSRFVRGTITVTNPTPSELTFNVADELNTPNDEANVICPSTGGAQAIVPAGGSETCTYSVIDADPTATSNTATVDVTVRGYTYTFTDTKPVVYVAPTIPTFATIVDQQIGLSVYTDQAGSAEATEGIVCSSDYADYGASGQYGGAETNTATLTPDGGAAITADAATSWLCEAGTARVIKLTEGVVDPSKDWSFTLYEGPDGFGGTALGTGTTLNNPTGVIDFDGPALTAGQTYTICESDAPAGWTAVWTVNGIEVIPYNPNGDDPVPEDLGNRCYDFTVAVGEVFTIEVNNLPPPGGDPRTPGYWKNWSSCSGGNQFEKGTLGDPTNDRWTLDELLNTEFYELGALPLGTPDGEPDGDLNSPHPDCEAAVKVLNHQDQVDERKNGNPIVRASDPAYKLARSLLAYELNQDAQACYSQTAADAAAAGHALLDEISFDGSGDYKKTLRQKDLTADALMYHGILDDYNNGEYCP